MNNDSRDGLIFGLSTAVVVVIGVVFCVGIGLLIFGLNNWGMTQNAKRDITINNIKAHGVRHGYEYQQTQRQAVTGDLEAVLQVGPQMVGQSEAERQALGDQRISEVSTLCSDAATVDTSTDPLSPQQAAFVADNCSGGTIKPSSPYETRKDQPTP